MSKPVKPNVTLPSEFALRGQKRDFSEDKILNGFSSVSPDVLSGDNLNKFIDDTYKSINYATDSIDDLYSSLITYNSDEIYNQNSIVFDIDSYGKIHLYISKTDNNTGNSLDNDTYWKEVSLGGSTRNVGELVYSSLPQTDTGLHLLDGALIQGSGSYSAFVDYIADLYTANPTANYFTDETTWQNTVTQYGVCGKFVYDSTNNTVRLPKVTGIVEGTTNLAVLGNLVQAGLPLSWFEHKHTRGDMNITGSVIFTETGDSDKSTIRSSSGAFTNTGGYGGGWGQIQPTDQNWVQRLDFDASRNWTGSTSTPNYTSLSHDASTVQPQTIKCFVYIVIATSTKTDIQVDIDEIATDLNGKADTDLSNTTDQAKILMGGMAMPSNRYIDLTLGASGTQYTAPANGYFGIFARSADTVRFEGLEYSVTMPNASNLVSSVIFPILKGKTITLNYGTLNLSESWCYFRFIYAQGSESEAN